MIFPPALQAPAPPRSEVRPEASVVQVTVKDGPRLRLGTGLVVGPGLVATNAHVVPAEGNPSVSQGLQEWPATVFRRDPARDLVLLRVPGCPLPVLPLADPADIREGQWVCSLGHPGGGALTRSEGRILAIWTFKGERMFQTDTLTRPGSSGGGIFDEAGRLVGITTFAYPDRPTATFALPARWVVSLSESPGPAPDRPEAPLPEAFAAAMAGEPGNWEAWERFCRAWTRETPQDAQAWMALGHALELASQRSREAGLPEAADQHAESLGAYGKALALGQEHPKAWNNLGAALEADNRFPEAERAFRRALELDPDYALAWVNLGTTYFNTARYAPAAEAFQRGLRGLPDQGAAWGRLGYCLLRLHRWAEARDALQIATRYLPFRADLWEDLANAARGAKDPGTASAATERMKALRTSR